jgi:NADPH-dependent 2,4-dienoyl-CoA reductase/sulfur reductase-like enzyme/rhodanese-related sulfurtransferase
MRIIVIGAVAAGTSAAAKARRNTEEAEIVIYEKDQDISYSGCGMPYFLGGEVSNARDLTPRDPVFFKSKYNVDIKIGHEVVSLDPVDKTLRVKNLETGEIFSDRFDKLIIATGATSIRPPIVGDDLDHVFTLRNIQDMMKIYRFLEEKRPQKSIIIGTGFIGLELCENFSRKGIDVTLVEKLDQVTPGLDPDMAVYVEEELIKQGIRVIKGASVEQITLESVNLEDGTRIEGELVILAAGVKPNTALAREAGIETGQSGAIRVNEKMETNLGDIYACGDCIEQLHLVTGKPVYRPLGSTANKTGRIAGDNASGGNLEFRGILGTGIFKVFGLTVGQTGLSQREALENGFEILVSHNIKPNKPEYMGGKELIIKTVAEKGAGRILGVQIIGEEGADKRLDVFATAISFGAKAEDLFHIDFGYAPPFSTTKDPVMYSGMILDNAINRGRGLISPEDLANLIQSGEKLQIIDARVGNQYQAGHVEGARNIPHEQLRRKAEELDSDLLTVTYCNKGVTGNAAQNILINKGFKKVYNISGGHKTYEKWMKINKI